MSASEKNELKRILIVDDEPSMLAILEVGLSSLYDVTTAGSGAEGLREFQRQPFDLVISDRAMPEMSGEQFAAAVKAHAPETPIILISGFGRGDLDGSRFAAFLQKPFRMRELLSTMDDLLPEAAKRRTGLS